jgi:uncharacterized protein YjlB
MHRRTGILGFAAWGAEAMLGSSASEPELLRFGKNGWMPNNERLPVLVYRGVLRGARDLTEKLEDLVRRHGWTPEWRNGVYSFHHYHSTAHEVLAFSRGEATLILGGEPPVGRQITVRAGDIALLPCGTGHFRLSSSPDFLVSGAYSLGQRWDLLRDAPDAATLERMNRLPFPESDPAGRSLARVWKY